MSVIAYFKQAIPAAGNNILYFANQTVTMMAVGRYLGATSLGHFALGLSLFNLAGLSLAFGFATALDTLASQAYGRGGRHSKELGILLQRAIVLNSALITPVIVLFFFSATPLQMCFEKELALGAASFLKAAIPLLIVSGLMICLQKVLQAQHAQELPTIARTLGAFVCPLACRTLVPAFGVPGAVFCVAIAEAVALIVVTIGAILDPRVVLEGTTWPLSPGVLTRKGVVQYCKIGFAGMVSGCAEWWAYEVYVMVAGTLGPLAVAVMGVVFNIILVLDSTGFAFGVAATVLIGNAFGAGDATAAKKLTKVGASIAIVVGIVDAVVLFFGHNIAFNLYTSDEEVKRALNRALPILMFIPFADGIQCTIQGAFRAAGKQASSARVILIGMWVCGVGSSMVLGFTATTVANGLHGMLLGMALGVALITPLLLRHMSSWDWEAIAAEAAKHPEEHITVLSDASDGDEAAVLLYKAAHPTRENAPNENVKVNYGSVV